MKIERDLRKGHMFLARPSVLEPVALADEVSGTAAAH